MQQVHSPSLILRVGLFAFCVLFHTFYCSSILHKSNGKCWYFGRVKDHKIQLIIGGDGSARREAENST